MKIKRLGFDARLIGETGVGRYIKNLLLCLSLIDPVNLYFIFLKSNDLPKFNFRNPNFHKIALDVKWHTLGEQLLLPFILQKYKLDLVHFPYFNVPLFYPGKYLVTVHDLIIDHTRTGRATTLPFPIYLAKRLFYKLILIKALKRAVKILTISKSTKKEIISHYQIPEDKILVTYDALDSDFLRLAQKLVPKKYYPFDYLLYVGNAYPHKNLEKLIMVMNDPQIKQRVKLVLAGTDWFFYPRLKKMVDQLKLKKSVYFFGNASDKQLIDLYFHARALIIPSLMEGFGLPNLEAVCLGVLPLVSDIKVFREIWGNSLLYFNPHDQDDIKRIIISALNLPKQKIKKLVAKAQTRIDRFSWQKTAKDTLLQYQKI